MTGPAVYTLAQVCARLGITRKVWYHRRRALEAAGFPARLPALKRWPAAAVDAWIASGGRPPPPDPSPPDPAVVDLERWRDVLGRRTGDDGGEAA